MKECTRCHKEKGESEFTSHRGRKDGLCVYCRDCLRLVRKENYAKRREGILRENRKWAKNNRHKINEQKQRKHEKDPDKRKNLFLRNQYGISVGDYRDMLGEQSGRCAICGKHQSELKQALSVDHDHATGKVRGLLCSSCNGALGLMEDNPTRMISGAIYLTRSK